MSLYTAQQIQRHSEQRGPNWKPARPINYAYDSWTDRLHYAWGVLKGKYDVVDWEDTQGD